jgi:hypothetical protein
MCGFCYSCHWKQEQLEKNQFKPLAITDMMLFTADASFHDQEKIP